MAKHLPTARYNPVLLRFCQCCACLAKNCMFLLQLCCLLDHTSLSIFVCGLLQLLLLISDWSEKHKCFLNYSYRLELVCLIWIYEAYPVKSKVHSSSSSQFLFVQTTEWKQKKIITLCTKFLI